MKNKHSAGKKDAAGKRTLQGVFGPLWKYYSDSDVMEIFVDTFDSLSIERKGKLETVVSPFSSGAAVAALVKGLAELPGSSSRRLGVLLDIRLSDLTQVTCAEGAAYQAVAIRKHYGRVLGWADLLKAGCVPEDARKLFDRILEQGKSVLVAGNSGSGKTTFLNVIANAIPSRMRLVAIQSAPELMLDHPACLCLNAGSDEEFVNLLQHAGRFSPDYLVVGQLDGVGVPEAVRAMRNGMPVVSCCHADSVLDALKRMEYMYLSSRTNFGLDEIRSLLASGIGYVSFQERGADGKRRMTELARLDGYEEGRYIIAPLMKYSLETGTFELTPAGKALLAGK
jgi:pilus assembly protein CpaF